MRSLRAFLSPEKEDRSADPASRATTLNSSEAPTVAQSDNEKTDEQTDPLEAVKSTDYSGHEQAVANHTTQSAKEEENGNIDDDDDANREYPTGLPLAIVTTGLCLSVLLVALVSDSCISSSSSD